MKKIIKYIIYAAIATLFIWTFVFLAGKAKKKPDVFELKNAFKSNIVKKTVATGSILPRKEIAIKPQVSGIISEIFVEPGEMVKTGDWLAKVRIIPNMENLTSAESRVNRAKINLDDATQDYNRLKELFDKEVISKSEFQKALTAYNNAREEFSSAENTLQLIKEGVTKSLSASSNTLVRSTIGGMVLDVPVREGYNVIQTNTFNDGTTIAIIADMGDMIFQGKIDESEVGKIHNGMKLEINIGAIENQKFNAILTYISPKGVTESGSIQFEIKADVKLQQGQFIRSGYSANANIILEQRDSVMVVDESLVRFRNDSSFVDVIIEEKPAQKFKETFVKLGLSDGVNVEIVRGIEYVDRLKGNKIDPNQLKKDQKK